MSNGVKIVVIGSGGLVGRRLCTKLSQGGTQNAMLSFQQLKTYLHKMTFFDTNISTSMEEEFFCDHRVTLMEGNLTSQSDIEKALDPEGCSAVATIHLAALLSGYAEENFDLGMDINVHGTLNVMNCIRRLGEELMEPQVYTYASTDYVACFNDANRSTPVTEESFRLSPVSYGVQKAAMELFICDYSRRGFLDGRAGRLSAVLGRPGWSNSISYPYTGIFTQPLEGKDYEVSLPFDVPYPCSNLQNNVDSLMYLTCSVMADELGHNRVVQLPATSYTLDEIWAATQEIAEEKGCKLGKVTTVPPESGSTTVKEINVCPYVDCSRAELLGFPMNTDVRDTIRDYIQKYVYTLET